MINNCPIPDRDIYLILKKIYKLRVYFYEVERKKSDMASLMLTRIDELLNMYCIEFNNKNEKKIEYIKNSLTENCYLLDRLVKAEENNETVLIEYKPQNVNDFFFIDELRIFPTSIGLCTIYFSQSTKDLFNNTKELLN